MYLSIVFYFYLFGFAMCSNLRNVINNNSIISYNDNSSIINYNNPGDILYWCKSNYQCPINSVCSQYNETTGICSCDINYATVTDFCQYKRKSALIGLLLTIFLQWCAPVGKMYALGGITSTNQVAQSTAIGEMFTCGTLGTLLILTPLSILICWMDEKSSKKVIYFVSGLLTFITICWFIIDIIGFVNNTILDQNGINLVPI
jgi:hypothetical protein